MTDPLEKMAVGLENKIMLVASRAMGDNGFNKKMWEEKYGKKVFCQVINEICLDALRTLRSKTRKEDAINPLMELYEEIMALDNRVGTPCGMQYDIRDLVRNKLKAILKKEEEQQ